MDKVSIIFSAHDNYPLTELCLRTAIEHAGVPVELCLFNNGCPDHRTQELCQKLCPDGNFVYFETAITGPPAIGYNELLLKCTGNYICIIPQICMLSKGWAHALVNHAAGIPVTGVTAVHVSGSRGLMTGLLAHEHEIISVWQPQTNILQGVMLFDRKFLKLIGGFDIRLSGGFELLQYTARLNAHGYTNYFIFDHSTVLPEYNDLQHLEGNNADLFRKTMVEMRSAGDYGIKIRRQPENEQHAYENIESLREKLHIDYSNTFFIELTGQFGVMLNNINMKNMRHVDQFCAVNSLTYQILGNAPFFPEGLTILFESKNA